MFNKTENITTGISAIIVGILLIILKASVLQAVMTILGILVLTMGILDLMALVKAKGVIELIMGVIILIFGWALISLSLYLMALLLLVFGIYQLKKVIDLNVRGFNTLDTISIFAPPCFDIVLAIFLLFNQRGTVSWVFIICGILLIIEGILLISNIYIKRKKNI